MSLQVVRFIFVSFFFAWTMPLAGIARAEDQGRGLHVAADVSFARSNADDARPRIALGGELGLTRYVSLVSSSVYLGLTWLSCDNAYVMSLGGRGTFIFLGVDVSPLLVVREDQTQLGARLRGYMGPGFVSVSAWRTPFGPAESWTSVVQVGGGIGHLFKLRESRDPN
jgi:hypothetical protein